MTTEIVSSKEITVEMSTEIPWTKYPVGIFVNWRRTRVLKTSIVCHCLVEAAYKVFIYRRESSVCS